jgi:hypothetical protein
MCTVFVKVMQFMPQLNASDVFQTVEYQPEDLFTRVHQTSRDTGTLPPALAFQLRLKLIKVSMNKRSLFRWYIVVHVLVRQALQDVTLPFLHADGT